MTYIKLIDLGTERSQKMNELVDMKARTLSMIDALEDDRYRIILRDYYISMDAWEKVAENNHWSIQHVHRLHGQALIQF